jgi:hypothetical protein
MTYFTKNLCTTVLAVVVSGLVFASPAPAAPKLSDADDAVIKGAIASCKAEAKSRNISFVTRRSFLRDCVTETIRKNPPKR